MEPSPPPPFVSTGSLPGPDDVRRAIAEVHQELSGHGEGRTSDVYPVLERADPDGWGIALVGVSGASYGAGDISRAFPIMSVAKPFVFALVCQAIGADEAQRLVGARATGRAFNSIAAVEAEPDGRTNPMVNAGAIASASLLPGTTPEEKWGAALEGLSAFAGRALEMDEEVYASASATNTVNRSLTWLLRARGLLAGEPGPVLDLYTRVCSLSVTAQDLAVMGATLADGGVNPVTGQRVIRAELCHHVLAVMMTAGFYELSGDWLYEVGLPGKSGIGGGVLTVSPGKGGLGTYSPRLDPTGTSVRGHLAAKRLSRRLGLDLLGSAAAG
nr:glutaminase A [Actinomycetales bacterium]